MFEKIHSLGITKRFNIALIVGFFLSLILGTLSGLFRYRFINHAVILVLVALLIAFIIQKIGNSVQQRFSLIAVLFTVIAIVISDVIAQYGAIGLFDIDSYFLIFKFAIYEDINSVIWLAYRVLAIYVSYVYSRII